MDKLNAIFQKVKQFLREVRAELRKVVWPTWKGTLGSTSVVIIVVIIVAIFLGIVDLGLTNAIKLILG